MHKYLPNPFDNNKNNSCCPRLRHALDLAEKSPGMVTRSASGSFRRLKRDLRSSSTEDSSSPGSSPKQRPQVFLG